MFTILCFLKTRHNPCWSVITLDQYITPNMTWYNDMAIFNNLSPLQLNKYLYHLCRWIRFLFTQKFINCCNHLHYFANLLWTRLFSCNIFNEHFYRVPHFWPQRSHYPLFALENYFWKYKTKNIASFICHCTSGNPAYGGSSPAYHKAKGVNLPYLDTRYAETDIWQKTHKKKKKNLSFNVGFQPYADHDIYRATIFFFLITLHL